MGAREILIKFLGETSGIKSSASEVEGSMQKVESSSGKAGGAIDGMIQKVPGLNTAYGGIKGVAQDAGDAAESAGGGMLGMVGGTVAAGAAIGAFALKAVGDYTNAAVAAGNFATATGTTVDQASRWIDVAKDHGIASDTVESAIGRMNKTAQNTPDIFDKFGLSIVHSKDGTVDANATFLINIDRLNGMKDPAEKAAAAAALFGKGWQGMAALIAEGSSGLADDLSKVKAGNVFDANDVKTAKDVKQGYADIKDSAEQLMNTVGKALAPVIAELAPELSKIIDAAAPLAKMIGGNLAEAFKALSPLIDLVVKAMPILVKGMELLALPATLTAKAIGAVGDAIESAFGGGKPDDPVGQLGPKFQAAGGGAKILSDAVEDLGEKQRAQSQNTADAAESVDAEALAVGQAATQHDALTAAMKLTDDAQKSVTDGLKDQVSALTDDLDAQKALTDAMRAASDAQFDVDSKTVAYKDSLSGLDQALKDAKGDADKQKVAYDNNTTAAGDLADAQVHLKEQTDAANGVTTSAKDKQDAWNAAMISASQQANGPARDAIANYIASANGIPAEKATQITAALRDGDIATATTLIDGASAARTASIKVDVDQASITAANAQIQKSMKQDVIVNVRTAQTGSGAQVGARAGGGPVKRGQTYVVGENHPELFTPDQDGYIDPKDPTSGGGYGGGVHIHIYGDITDGVQAKLDKFGADIVARLNAGRRN